MVNTHGFFLDIFKNARENSVILMDDKGYILDVNKGFVNAFGYKLKDVVGNHFRILFTEKDKKIKKPENEVKEALKNGSKSDNNYLVNKAGETVWVMGESVSVHNTNNEKYIVKIIQDIHAQKRLEHFLLESTEFVDAIFDSLKDTALIIFDSSMKVLKANKTFVKMFQLSKMPEEGKRLAQIENTFWKGNEIKLRLIDVLVNNKPIKNEEYSFKNNAGKEKVVNINSKLMQSEERAKRVLLVIKNHQE